MRQDADATKPALPLFNSSTLVVALATNASTSPSLSTSPNAAPVTMPCACASDCGRPGSSGDWKYPVPLFRHSELVLQNRSIAPSPSTSATATTHGDVGDSLLAAVSSLNSGAPVLLVPAWRTNKATPPVAQPTMTSNKPSPVTSTTAALTLQTPAGQLGHGSGGSSPAAPLLLSAIQPAAPPPLFRHSVDTTLAFAVPLVAVPTVRMSTHPSLSASHAIANVTRTATVSVCSSGKCSAWPDTPLPLSSVRLP